MQPSRARTRARERSRFNDWKDNSNTEHDMCRTRNLETGKHGDQQRGKRRTSQLNQSPDWVFFLVFFHPVVFLPGFFLPFLIRYIPNCTMCCHLIFYFFPYLPRVNPCQDDAALPCLGTYPLHERASVSSLLSRLSRLESERSPPL